MNLLRFVEVGRAAPAIGPIYPARTVAIGRRALRLCLLLLLPAPLHAQLIAPIFGITIESPLPAAPPGPRTVEGQVFLLGGNQPAANRPLRFWRVDGDPASLGLLTNTDAQGRYRVALNQDGRWRGSACNVAGGHSPLFFEADVSGGEVSAMRVRNDVRPRIDPVSRTFRSGTPVALTGENFGCAGTLLIQVPGAPYRVEISAFVEHRDRGLQFALPSIAPYPMPSILRFTEETKCNERFPGTDAKSISQRNNCIKAIPANINHGSGQMQFIHGAARSMPISFSFDNR